MPVIVGLLVGACGILFPGERLVIGRIDGDFQGLVTLVVPDSVMADTDFRVTVTTFGDGCTLRIGKTEVEVHDNVATITPYVYELTDEVCAAIPTYLSRETVLRFPKAGEGKVILRGRNGSGPGDIITISRTVRVY